MKFTPLAIAGAQLVEPSPIADERGSFSRTYCVREFREAGIADAFVQFSESRNRRAGTLRGMHYSVGSGAETKLVRCTRGAVHDVLLDLRPASPTYLHWQGTELSEDNGRALFVPAGVAHGFQTLTDDASVFYQISALFDPAAGRGVRWDDPAFAIDWPATPERIMSPRDACYPDFDAKGHASGDGRQWAGAATL